MDLTNREIASLILIALITTALLVFARRRSENLSGTRGLVRALLDWKFAAVVAVYLVYATAIVAAAAYAGLWNIHLLKDTLITTLFVGFPLIMNSSKVRSGAKLAGSVIREAIGLSAFLAFYFGLASFSIPGEIFLQLVIIVLVLLSAVGRRTLKTYKIARGSDWLLSGIGVGLTAFTTYALVSRWDQLDIADITLPLALSIWLPLLLLPLLYTLAILMSAGRVFALLPLHNDKTKPSRRVHLAFLYGIHFSAFYAAHFTGQWLRRLARQSGFRGALEEMRRYRKNVRRNVKAEKDRLEQLRTMSGLAGTDEHGLRRDRREFGATKEILCRLFYMQMGWHQNRLGHFNSDILELLGDVTKYGLPAQHGIEFKIRRGGQAWYAWRETPSGWFFGIGGDRSVATEWQYDGAKPPATFPNEEAGWTNVSTNPSWPEWTANDAPIRVS